MQIIENYVDMFMINFKNSNGYSEITHDKMRAVVYFYLSNYYNEEVDRLGYDDVFRKMIGGYSPDLEDLQLAIINKNLHDMALELSKCSKD